MHRWVRVVRQPYPAHPLARNEEFLLNFRMREQIIEFNFAKPFLFRSLMGRRADRMACSSAPFSRSAMIGGEADVGGSGAETGSVIYRGAGNLDKSRDSGLLRDVVENILARLSILFI